MKYSPELRTAAIESHLADGQSIAQISMNTGVPRSTLYNWLQQHRQKEQSQKNNSQLVTLQNIYRLEAKIERLERIVSILKTVPCTVHAPLSDRLNAIEQLQGQYSIHMLCEAMDVSRGTFYNHIFRNKRDNTWYAQRREELRLQIQEIYDDSKQIFGAQKIAAILRNKGMESFFASMKREELYRTKYRSEREFKEAVDSYIEFYNDKRPHAKLKYKTPNQKEAEYAGELCE